MKNVYTYLFGLSFVFLLTMDVHAATYKYRDADGRTVYAQHPPVSGPYQVIDTPKNNQYGSGNSAAPVSNQTGKPSLQDRSKQIDEKDKLAKDIASETEKNQKLRENNCKTARKNLEVYQVYRRFKDDKGNVVRMSDTDRQKKIDEARDAIKQFCN
mgnify:CR=1 FL=1